MKIYAVEVIGEYSSSKPYLGSLLAVLKGDHERKIIETEDHYKDLINRYVGEIRALEDENKQLRERIYKAAKYCRLSQEIMIARVICALLFAQDNWREFDFEVELNKIKASL